VDDLAQMGEQHRDRIDRLETRPPGVLDESLGDRDRPYTERRFAHFVPWHIGARSIPDDNEVVRNPQFLGRDRGAVDLDLIGPRRRAKIVGETDLRNHEAVLARELASHLGDTRADLVAGRQQRGVELLAQDQLDLERLELLLDRGARLSLGPLVFRRRLRRLGDAVLLNAPGE